MIAEALLTRIMRRKVGRILSFDMGSAFAGSPSLPAADPQRSTLLYAHIPFCDELCPYCSFNRVRLDRDLARRYFVCLEHELEIYSELGWRFNAIYVGGGTPTILPQQLAAFLRKARKLWPIRNISVETNPNHLTPAILSLLRECGVNRLSVGVQSFDDAILRAIGRYERYGSGREIAERLQDTLGRFDTLNADLIFNFPAQTERMFLRDLDTVAGLELDQVTFYPLMAASRVRSNLAKLGRIDPRQEKRLYMKIWDVLGERYEPSSAWCFSRRDSSPERRMIDEYIVEHSEYAGLGSGSFGYAGATIYANTFDITGYIDRLDRGTLPIAAARYAIIAMIVLAYLVVAALIAVRYFTPVMAVVLLAVPSLKKVFPAFLKPKPESRPEDFPDGQGGWPLYFAPLAFVNNRAFGMWFILGLLIDVLLRIFLPAFWR